MALAFFKANNAICGQLIHPLKLLTHTNGPVHGRTLNLQNVLNFVQHLNGIANFPIELVNEGDDGSIPQTTNLHQLDGARLDALGAINNHQR